MKEIIQIEEFILQRISNIYHRPLMYGGSAEGVDLILHYYHEIWAQIFEKQEEYFAISRDVHNKQNCGAANFSFRCRSRNKCADEGEIAKYVVSQWAVISKKLGLQLPLAE